MGEFNNEVRRLMTYRVGVIGLGYVGLPLAIGFSEKYEVIGFDIDPLRIEQLNNGIDRTGELSKEELFNEQLRISYSSNVLDLKECNFYIITVPTPVDDKNKPDLSPLQRASDMVSNILKVGDIVVYESTVYPGVTEDVCVPILEQGSNLQFNKDFFCGYSPERINPGDKNNTFKNIVKVTSGSTAQIANVIDDIYSSVVSAGTYKAASIKVAEASKVIENTQRDVNIALMNELSIIFSHLGISTTQVLEAAGTKWNFLKFFPGLVGGHCIGVDPYYLTYRAEELGYTPNLILASRQINDGMGKHIAQELIKKLILKGLAVKGAEVLILGYTFKEDCPDTRNTKVEDVIHELLEYGVVIESFDPYVDDGASPLEHQNRKYDAVVLAVPHKEFLTYSYQRYTELCKDTPLIFDLKAALNGEAWSL